MVSFPPCPKCKGTGEVQEYDGATDWVLVHDAPCPDCGGKGVLITDEMRQVVAEIIYPKRHPTPRDRRATRLAIEALVDYLKENQT